MSRLLVDSLATAGELFQTVTPTENINIEAIYLGIYVSRTPGGSLVLDLRDNSDGTASSSAGVTVTSISSAFGDTFGHGLVRFDLKHPVRKDLTYRLTLRSTGGYTESATDFIAWKRDFDHTSDNLRRVPTSYTGGRGYNAPFDYLVVAEKRFKKGIL